jgi:hypothetical protein
MNIERFKKDLFKIVKMTVEHIIINHYPGNCARFANHPNLKDINIFLCHKSGDGWGNYSIITLPYDLLYIYLDNCSAMYSYIERTIKPHLL